MYLQGGTVFIFEEVCGSRIKFRFDLLNNFLSFERIILYSPGHFLALGLHDLVSLFFPREEQSLPPFWGCGLLQNLSRVFSPEPFPQVFEHALHFPQGL